MSGFPTRPNRDSYGPEYENERPVTDAKREIDESIHNLIAWQLAGAGLVAPKAVLVVTQAATALTTVSQLLAFDPNGAVSTLTWTYNGAGDFSLDFAPQYPDEQGNNVNLALVGGIAISMGATPYIGSVDLTSGYELETYFETDAGVPVDPDKFVLILW